MAMTERSCCSGSARSKFSRSLPSIRPPTGTSCMQLPLACWAGVLCVAVLCRHTGVHAFPPPPGARAPTFDRSVLSNVTTSVEQTVRLTCRINHLYGKTVTWLRSDKNKILTIGSTEYTPDTRFTVLRTNDSRDWVLQIKYPRTEDSGQYECQVSTQPKISFIVQLNVIVGKVKISGPDIVDIGDTLVIKCNITTSLPTNINKNNMNSFVTWTLNQSLLLNDVKSGVRIESELSAERHLLSDLIIKHVSRKHAGTYTCSPSNRMHSTSSSNVQRATHYVRVTQERKPAQLRSSTSASVSVMGSTPSRQTSAAVIALSTAFWIHIFIHAHF